MTHVVASEAETSGPLWRAKVAQGLNIVGLSWLLECAAKRAGVPLRPRHYLARRPGSFDDDPDVDRWGDECGPALHAFAQLSQNIVPVLLGCKPTPDRIAEQRFVVSLNSTRMLWRSKLGAQCSLGCHSLGGVH